MSEAVTSLDLRFGLCDKVAVITGGGSGIGAAIAGAYSAKGAQVIILDLQADAAERRGRQLGFGSFGLGCDVSDPSSVRGAIEAAMAVCGHIDILVNSAGIAALAPAEDLSYVDWERTIAVNLTGTFLVAQAVGKYMIDAGWGRIINIASQAGSVALDEHLAYCASKFGVIGLTKVLASEWAGRGVTVNSISPTVVLTDLGRKAWSGPKGDAMKTQIPTGRFALPEEVAAAAVFLASDAAAMINGADLPVDGGYTIR